MKWRLVIIESPLMGKGFGIIKLFDELKNRNYLDKCILHCINRGDSPYASHKMLTDALNDANASERQRGIMAGLAWAVKASAICVYIDRGVSRGMFLGIDASMKVGRAIEFYSIEKTEQLSISLGELKKMAR